MFYFLFLLFSCRTALIDETSAGNNISSLNRADLNSRRPVYICTTGNDVNQGKITVTDYSLAISSNDNFTQVLFGADPEFDLE